MIHWGWSEAIMEAFARTALDGMTLSVASKSSPYYPVGTIDYAVFDDATGMVWERIISGEATAYVAAHDAEIFTDALVKARIMGPVG